MTGFPKRCPRCGSRDLRDIVYGTPQDRALVNLWARGDLMLRPPRVTDGKGPGWMCGECGLEAADVRPPKPLPANWRRRCGDRSEALAREVT